jgi:hypothetical protein
MRTATSKTSYVLPVIAPVLDMPAPCSTTLKHDCSFAEMIAKMFSGTATSDSIGGPLTVPVLLRQGYFKSSPYQDTPFGKLDVSPFCLGHSPPGIIAAAYIT